MIGTTRTNDELIKQEIFNIGGEVVLKDTFQHLDLQFYDYAFQQGDNVYEFIGGRDENSSDFKDKATSDGLVQTQIFETMFDSFKFLK